jgi:hypothetical protein
VVIFVDPQDSALESLIVPLSQQAEEEWEQHRRLEGGLSFGE